MSSHRQKLEAEVIHGVAEAAVLIADNHFQEVEEDGLTKYVKKSKMITDWAQREQVTTNTRSPHFSHVHPQTCMATKINDYYYYYY